MAIRVVGWNVAQRVQTVDELLDMDADVALLQGAGTGILEELAHAGGDVTPTPKILGSHGLGSTMASGRWW